MDQSRIEQIKQRVEAALQMVIALCKPKGTAGARDWIMSIPARRDHDPDLVIGDALQDAREALAALAESQATISDKDLELEAAYKIFYRQKNELEQAEATIQRQAAELADLREQVSVQMHERGKVIAELAEARTYVAIPEEGVSPDKWLRVGPAMWLEAQAELSRLRADAKRLDWQPIATAPKDGTAVQLLSSGNRVSVARFVKIFPHREGWAVQVPCMGGWGEGTDTLIHWPEDQPLYWMPLPDPPADAAMSAQEEASHE